MGSQSDIYLGWVGKDAIIKVMGEDFYREHYQDEDDECEQHCRDEVVPKSTILAYLKSKYGFVPTGYLRDSFDVSEVSIRAQDNEDVGEEAHALGIQLTGRYSPAFLDFRSEHGGMYAKVFNKDLIEDIEWFRSQLVQQEGLERYATAEIFVLDNFY